MFFKTSDILFSYKDTSNEYYFKDFQYRIILNYDDRIDDNRILNFSESYFISESLQTRKYESVSNPSSHYWKFQLRPDSRFDFAFFISFVAGTH